MSFPDLSRLRAFLPSSPLGRAVFLALLFTGIFLRTAALTWGIPDANNQSSVYHDEGHVLSFVLKSHEDFKKDFGEYEIVRPVYLYRLVGRPLITLGDALRINNDQNRIFELAALRSASTLFGIVGLIAVYGLGKQIASPKAGLWALAFLTFMPAHWYYSQILKGDIMVATLFTLVLICAIQIARTGSRPSYLWGAVILGAGVSFKATTAMAAPVLLLAHLLFAWKQRRWSTLVSSNATLAVLLAAVSFALLYPYPFYDYAQYKYLVENPSIQHLTPKFLVSPATYLATIKQYHSPTRPFFEMIFGKFLLWSFLPSLAVVLGMTIYHLVKRRRVELLLVMALFVLFFHSLTFSDALDERYVLPFAPFAALFPALVVTGFRGGSLIGALLLIGTTAITGVLFPPFAFTDPRREAVEWIRARAPAGATIAQASQTSRWALVFDSGTTYNNNSFVYGPPELRHVARLVTPDYVVLQQEPWNYDHTFRYELSGIDKEKELAPFLARYQQHEVFGRVPTLLGWRIPQTLGTPVIHVYASPTSAKLDGARTERLTVEAPAAVTSQSKFTPSKITQRFEEPTVIEENGVPIFVIPTRQTVSVLLHFPRPHEVEFYLENEGKVSFYGSGIVQDDSRIYAFSI